MFKLKKIIGDRTIAKFYESQTLAEKRKTKDWELESSTPRDYTARSINKGKLELPKYRIEAGDDVIHVMTEGTANKLVEELSRVYPEVKAYKLIKMEIKDGSDDI